MEVHFVSTILQRPCGTHAGRQREFKGVSMSTISYRLVSRKMGESLKIRVPDSNGMGSVEIHVDLTRVVGDEVRIGVEAPIGVSVLESESHQELRDSVVLPR